MVCIIRMNLITVIETIWSYSYLQKNGIKNISLPEIKGQAIVTISIRRNVWQPTVWEAGAVFVLLRNWLMPMKWLMVQHRLSDIMQMERL